MEYTCKICGKVYKREHYYKKHLLTHTKNEDDVFDDLANKIKKNHKVLGKEVDENSKNHGLNSYAEGYNHASAEDNIATSMDAHAYINKDGDRVTDYFENGKKIRTCVEILHVEYSEPAENTQTEIITNTKEEPTKEELDYTVPDNYTGFLRYETNEGYNMIDHYKNGKFSNKELELPDQEEIDNTYILKFYEFFNPKFLTATPVQLNKLFAIFQRFYNIPPGDRGCSRVQSYVVKTLYKHYKNNLI
jgi:hypothetical protein